MAQVANERTARGKAARVSSTRWERFWTDLWKQRVSYLFVAPFVLCFAAFILLPVGMAVGLSFTDYNGFSFPHFIGLNNYMALFTQDLDFMQYALPNTLAFAFFVGPIGYALNFLVAWFIYQLPKRFRDGLTLAFYAPSMAGAVALSVVWQVMFSGDSVGYLNSYLQQWGLIQSPVLWLQDPQLLLGVMIFVTLLSGFGVGFLAMLAGFDTVNPELYEAGRIDGIANRLQELFYITLPSMKPQMLFSAVMAIVGTLQAGAISQALTGVPVTSNYAGYLIANEISDYAFIRYELGYAAMLSVVLLLMGYLAMRLSYRLFGAKEGE